MGARVNDAAVLPVERDPAESDPAGLDPAALDPADLNAALVAQVRDYAMLALDVDGVIRTWNAGAESVKGYRAEEIIGRHFSVFYPEPDRIRRLPEQLLAQAHHLGRVEHTGWRLRKDGTRFWGNVVITALHGPDGRLTGYGKVTRDLTEEHALQTALHTTQEKLRLLVSQVVDYAIIAMDCAGVIETWNAGAESVKGYTAAEILGRHFSVFYPEQDRHRGLPQLLVETARREGRVEHTGWRVRKDGTRFWGHVVITALRDDTGEVTGFGKVTRDLTERRRVESARDSFLAAVSHDLKTPLTALKGFATLLPTADEEERREFSKRIVANADRLSILVDDLVDHAALRAGGVQLARRQQSVTDLVKRTVADLASLLVHHRVRVDAADVVAAVDGHVVERILANLLSNAAKYSAAGTDVVVTLTVREARLRLCVADSGRGISSADLPVIFDEFQRGRLAGPDGGTGLGLSSVKQLAILHGGEVTISSRLHHGTEVVVELPLQG